MESDNLPQTRRGHGEEKTGKQYKIVSEPIKIRAPTLDCAGAWQGEDWHVFKNWVRADEDLGDHLAFSEAVRGKD